MANLTIFVNEPVHAGENHTVGVRVTNCAPGLSVDVTLTQTQGKPPFIAPKSTSSQVGPSGDGFVSFSVVLSGPTSSATLLASAKDANGAYYSPDARSFEVEP